MPDDITFLSERQNNHLIEQVFSATDYKNLKVFIDSFKFKPYKVKMLSRRWDIEWLYDKSLSKYSDFIFNTNHIFKSDFIYFKLFDGGEAALHIYHSAGLNKEPIPIIHYYYPIKIINIPFIIRCREISKCIDVKSHRIFKDPVYEMQDKYGFEKVAKALLKIESKHLIEYYERNCLPNVSKIGEFKPPQTIDSLVKNQKISENREFQDTEIKSPQHDLANPKEVAEEYRIYDQDTSAPPPLPSEGSAEPPTLPEDSSHSKEKVYSIEETKFDSIIIIIATIIISSVILLIAIGFIFTAIEYLGSSSDSSLSSTIQATATPSQAATPPKVHSTLQVVSPQKLESFILKTETDLEIREEPTANCKIIAKIPAKSYIISIKKDHTEQNGLEWSLITLGPYEGWVPKPLLSKITKYQK